MNVDKRYSACSFTGHRRIEKAHVKTLPDLLLRAVEYVYCAGCCDFYAGGAIGFDTYAAQAVIEFRKTHGDVRLHLLLPCENQSARWSDKDKAVYINIMKQADDVQYLAHSYYDGCMKQRNERLVTSADVIVAYLGRDFGGSAQTVRLAKSAGKDVFNLYPTLSGLK